MTHLMQVHDLTSLPGITGYVEQLLQHDIRAAFDKNGGIQPFGVALGEITNGTKLPRPQPMVVGGRDTRSARRQLRTLTKNSGAQGAIFCHQLHDPDAIIIQLEHKVHGDLVWTARIVRDALEPFTEAGDVAACHFEVKQTTFLPRRYMQ